MNNQDIESLYKVFLEHPSICTDSRRVEQGDFFVALPGERVDGNTFAEAALEQGAAVALVSDSSLAERAERCIYTEDTQRRRSSALSSFLRGTRSSIRRVTSITTSVCRSHSYASMTSTR